VKITYLKFDLSSLASATVDSAKLRLLVRDSSPHTQNVRSVGSSGWSETAVTYNTRPAVGPVIRTLNGGAAGATIEIDITSAVVAGRGGLLSLAIDSTGSNGIDFGSREWTTKPQLVITRR
jgi:hypothetical protein